MNCKPIVNRKLLHELQMYIRPGIECELTSLPDGRWFMPFARLVNMAADGLVQAIVAGRARCCLYVESTTSAYRLENVI